MELFRDVSMLVARAHVIVVLLKLPPLEARTFIVARMESLHICYSTWVYQYELCVNRARTFLPSCNFTSKQKENNVYNIQVYVKTLVVDVQYKCNLK